MHKGERLRSGAPLSGFDEAAKNIFDGFFATYGFKPEMSRVDQYFAMRRFRNGHRYITIELRTNPKETPSGKVRLGTGSSEWPDAEWNQILLSQLVAVKSATPDAGELLVDGRLMAAVLDDVSKALQDYAMDFIAGELREFKKIRAESARKREPFQPQVTTSYSENTLSFLKTSRALKERYSREDAA